MEIVTNNHPRELLYATDVPAEILSSQFDYQHQHEDGYIRYQNNWYHLDQFMRCDADNELATLGYSGYYADSFFSGVLLKVIDNERVIIASYRI